jgi:prepilin-type N-terminal cleavage/methylation domain-containing protein
MKSNLQSGFTLAELLIALSILGVIATFTIPKVLQAQQDSKASAIAKETVAAVSESLQAYKLKNSLSSTISMGDLTPFLNYVSTFTGNIDRGYGDTTMACDASNPCLSLHNGAVLLYTPADSFNGTASTNAIYFYLDPDGKVTDGTTNGPGKSILFFLYYTGRVTTWGNASPGTKSGPMTYSADPSKDPPWFRW